MKLTGKCKEAFEYNFNMSNFNELSETLQNALIIDFFDSVGIYVNVLKYNDKWKIIADTQFRYLFESRQEATKAAIAKAVEIFNNRLV